MVSKIDNIGKDVEKLKINEAKVGENLRHIADNVDEIKQDVHELKTFANTVKEKILKEVDEHYTTNDRFEPVRLIAYGAVGAILLLVIGALMGVIFLPHV